MGEYLTGSRQTVFFYVGIQLLKLRHIDEDTVAEWLRRWIANPLLFERESSNLSSVDFLYILGCEPVVVTDISPPLFFVSAIFPDFPKNVNPRCYRSTFLFVVFVFFFRSTML